MARSDAAFAALPAERVHRLRYEDFVTDPTTCLTAIARFAGLCHDRATLEAACADVRRGSVGGGRALSEDEELERIMRPTLLAHGYR